jgi:predicted Zn-dependent protease
MTNLEKKCITFILQCVFGNIDDPVTAAIDRAYVDMASHTMQGFKEEEYQDKWKCRYDASKKIKESVENYDEICKKGYDKWHDDLCLALKDIYPEKTKFSYGQAQKWVNMTTKYLTVLAVIFKSVGEDERLDEIPRFFKEDHVNSLHIPLDSYIMQEYGISNYGPWSQMEKDEYRKCREVIKEHDKTLMDELTDWGIAAAKHRTDDKKSYAYFVEMQRTNKEK